MKVHYKGTTLHFLSIIDTCIVFVELYLLGTFKTRPLKKKPVIIDCGSYIGLSLIYFKQRYPEATIIAFEPDPKAFSYLKKNVHDNNLKHVTLHQKALSNKKGTISFLNGVQSIGNHITHEQTSKKENVTKVKADVLSNYIKSPVDLIKLDIEGAENIVLREIELKLDNVKNIIIEYHHGLNELETDLDELVHILESNGFNVRRGKFGAFWHKLHKVTRLPIPHTNIIYGEKVY